LLLLRIIKKTDKRSAGQYSGSVRLTAVLATPVARPLDVNLRIIDDDMKAFDQTVTVMYVIEKLLHMLSVNCKEI
jgi:hypothetical protein